MQGIAWIVAASALLAGCFDTPQEVLDDLACEHLSRCVPGLDQDLCLQFLTPVSEECFELATGHSQECSLLLESVMTGGVCRQPEPIGE